MLKNISHVFDTPGKLSKSSLKDYKNPRQIREKVCNKLYTDFGVYKKSEHKGFQKTQSESVTCFELSEIHKISYMILRGSVAHGYQYFLDESCKKSCGSQRVQNTSQIPNVQKTIGKKSFFSEFSRQICYMLLANYEAKNVHFTNLSNSI